MKLFLTLILLGSLIAQSVPKRLLESIQEKDLKKHLSFIASDEMRGRDTGSPELKIVARYLASHLEAYGYKGLGENGSFFQPVPLYKTQFMNSSLKLWYDGKELNFENGKDLAVYGFGDQNIDMELD
ncbi:MAG: hypothetical protein KDD94_13570, partial [Calditrichaeota bacterium]|nr:hypothetical protein [Calditrichota bacterium]